MGSNYTKTFLFSFISSLLIGICQLSFAQDKAHLRKDSLKSAYQNAAHDTTKAKLLLALSEHIYLSNPDTVIPLCQKAIEIIDENLPHANHQEKISFLHIKAGALNNIGFIHQQQGDIEQGLEYYFESLKINEEFFLPENEKKWSRNLQTKTFLKFQQLFKKGLANAYNNIGVIYDNQGEIDKGLEYYFLSLKIREAIKDKKEMADTYNNIGIIYRNQGEIEKTLEYFFLSLKIREEIKYKRGMAQSYNNIGFIYEDQGEIEKALEYYFLSLKIQEEIEDKIGMAYSYNNIGSTYENQGEIDKGLKYYFLSLKIREEIKDKNGMAESYHNIGVFLCKQNSLEEGMRYLKLGLELAMELKDKVEISVAYSSIGKWQLKLGQVEIALESGLEALAVAKEVGHVEYTERAAELLGNVYKKQSKFEDALIMYELEIQMRDSFVNEET
ncbi:MAG: tetratricopeptide repeat protein, partial [Bacteroidia bacterium]|nr:tetratricopeptide repeat protein [Bacteroidia bacterium]